MTFSEYVAYYESAILSLGKTSSRKSTKSRLRKWTAEFGDKDLPLNKMDIQRAITKLSTQYPPQTTRNLWLALSAVLQRAKADGVITEVPEPILPKVEKQDQPWYRPEEMRALARYEPLYAAAAETGMRIGELLAVQNQDIDFEAKTLTIKRNIYDGVLSTPKTRAGTRCISISGWLRDILAKQCLDTDPGTFVFRASGNRPLNPNSETIRLAKTCRLFGIDPAGFHGFRRGNATLQASVIGVAEKLIAYRLGHSNLGLTLGRYAQYLVGMDRDVAERIAELIK